METNNSYNNRDQDFQKEEGPNADAIRLKEDKNFINQLIQELYLKKHSEKPMHTAIYNNDLEEVKKLLGEGVDINDQNDMAICHAAFWGRLPIIEFLIANGANVNDKNINGNTPLHAAAFMKHLDIVNLLIEKSVNISAKNNMGITSLSFAAQAGDIDIIKVLLKNDADVNTQDNLGNAPLHISVFMGHKDVVEFLLEHGADANIKNNSGNTPVDFAKEVGYEDIIQLLLQENEENSAGVHHEIRIDAAIDTTTDAILHKPSEPTSSSD
ncbi:MAG: uncharacterized protein K0R73_153 [Candidatus Midichloriaceae bacterium]|jgi:ankyrin repeat protein|nr:uncharacterized protein [Candidatus Midichloriaceae bacterium]